MRIIILIVAMLAVSCEGAKGDKGDKGDPGKDGTEISADQVLERIKTKDGEGSGLDADTLDGTELKTILDRIAVLESQVADLQGKLNDSTLNAYLPGNVLLGPVVSVQLDSIIYFEANERVNMPVEVFVRSFESLLQPKMDSTLHDVIAYFADADCEGRLYFPADGESSHFIGVLDNVTGVISIPEGLRDQPFMKSYRAINDPEAECHNEVGFAGKYYQYNNKITMENFDPRPYVCTQAVCGS